MGVSITVINHADPILAGAIRHFENFQKPLRIAGMYQQRSFLRQFEASGTPQWKPLSARTVARRRKRSDKPLLDTGRLRRSYTSRAAGSIWRMEPLRLTIGSNLVYARIHQEGGDAGRNHSTHIPARPLRMRDEDRREIVRIFRRYLGEAFRR